MKSQIRRTIRAHLLRVAFYLLLLLAACAIPFALAQRNVATRSKAKASPVSELPVTSTAAAAPAIACRIEYIEADPVRPWRNLRCVIAIINAKDPFLLTSIAHALALSEPVHVARSFPAGKIEGIRPDPCRDGKFTRCGNAVVGGAWNLDIVFLSVEPEIDVALPGRCVRNHLLGPRKLASKSTFRSAVSRDGGLAAN